MHGDDAYLRYRADADTGSLMARNAVGRPVALLICITRDGLKKASHEEISGSAVAAGLFLALHAVTSWA